MNPRKSTRISAPPRRLGFEETGPTAPSPSSILPSAFPNPENPSPEGEHEEDFQEASEEPNPPESQDIPLPSVEVKQENITYPFLPSSPSLLPRTTREPGLQIDPDDMSSSTEFTAAQQARINDLINAAVANALSARPAAPSPAHAPTLVVPEADTERYSRALTADLLPPTDYYLPDIDPTIAAVDAHKVKYPRVPFSNHNGEITYNAWKMAMKVFIEEYSGNFVSGRSQILAYFKCTTGEAQNLILEHMDPVFSHEFRNAADVLKMLDQRFFDHNYVQAARGKYNRLVMSASMTYDEFRSKFVHFATAGKIDRSRWFDDVCDKVSPALKNDLRLEKYKMGNNYATLDEFLAIADRETRNIKSEEARRQAPAAPQQAVTFSSRGRVRGILKKETWRPTSPARSPSPAPPSAKATSPAPKGACHNCGEAGHWSPNCPKPLRDARLDKKIAEIDIGDDLENDPLSGNF